MEKKIINLDSRLTRLYYYGKGWSWTLRHRIETDRCSYRANIIKGLCKIGFWGALGTMVLALIILVLTIPGVYLLFPLVVGAPLTSFGVIQIKRAVFDPTIRQFMDDSKTVERFCDNFESFFSLIWGMLKDFKERLCISVVITNENEEKRYRSCYSIFTDVSGGTGGTGH